MSQKTAPSESKKTESEQKSPEKKSLEKQVSASSSSPEKSGKGWGFKQWLIVYGSIFLVFQIAIFIFVSQGGESRARSIMLDTASSYYEEGNYQEALETLLTFGEKWPGAYNTQNFNRRIGEYYLAAGEYKQAEEHIKKSISLNSQIPGGWAQQGLAVWKQERYDAAAALFSTELQRGDKRSDLAYAYLGLYHYQNENFPLAFEYFASVREDAEIDIDMDKYREEFKDKYLSSAE